MGTEIMGTPKVFVVYWDALYNTRPDVVQRMNQCITDLITGPYMNSLAQYRISAGTFLGSVVVDSTVDIPPNPMTEGHLQWHIYNWAGNGTIPFVGDLNTLFLIFTPNGVVLQLGPDSSPDGTYVGLP